MIVVIDVSHRKDISLPNLGVMLDLLWIVHLSHCYKISVIMLVLLFSFRFEQKICTIQTVYIKGLIEGCHITYFHHVNTIFWAKTVIVTLLHLCVTDHKTLIYLRRRKILNFQKFPMMKHDLLRFVTAIIALKCSL